MTGDDVTGLRGPVRRGLAWSAVSNIVLKLGNLAFGILLARLLTPEQFGVYAVALTLQTVLLTLAYLGLNADLVRADDPRARAPTLATLGLVAGATLTTAVALGAEPIAAALGSPEAAPVLAVLSFTLVLASAGVVPGAMLARRFDQKRLFLIAAVDMAVYAAVTVILILAEWGQMALAVGRVAAQGAVLVLSFVLAGERPRFGVDRRLVRSVLAFSLPVAGANILSWALLGIDKLIIVGVAGPEALGYYVLAFTISTWPMIAVAQTVRSVAMPAFARVSRGARDRSLALAMAPTWAVAVPAGGMLAVLAVPLVLFVYGSTWEPAAELLVPLAIFGGIRISLDLIATYLLARGASVSVLVVQIGWFAVLFIALLFGMHEFGVTGAAYAHIVVALVVVLPAYLFVLGRVGADVSSLVRVAWQPLAAVLPAAGVAFLLAREMSGPFAALALGGVAGGTVYAALIFRWLRRQVLNITTSGLGGLTVSTDSAEHTRLSVAEGDS